MTIYTAYFKPYSTSKEISCPYLSFDDACAFLRIAEATGFFVRIIAEWMPDDD